MFGQSRIIRLLLLTSCFAVFLAAAALNAQSQTHSVVFNTSNVWNVPSGVSSVTVELWCGGGGEAGGATNTKGFGGAAICLLNPPASTFQPYNCSPLPAWGTVTNTKWTAKCGGCPGGGLRTVGAPIGTQRVHPLGVIYLSY